MIAHIAGVPVEEFQVPLAGGVGAAVLMLRAWVQSRVASKSDRRIDR